MNNSNPYQAVSCSMHSELELAIMHGKYLTVYYAEKDKQNDSSDEQIITIKPSDVITRGDDNKGEFLVGTDKSGQPVEIRLDNINQYLIV